MTVALSASFSARRTSDFAQPAAEVRSAGVSLLPVRCRATSVASFADALCARTRRYVSGTQSWQMITRDTLALKPPTCQEGSADARGPVDFIAVGGAADGDRQHMAGRDAQAQPLQGVGWQAQGDVHLAVDLGVDGSPEHQVHPTCSSMTASHVVQLHWWWTLNERAQTECACMMKASWRTLAAAASQQHVRPPGAHGPGLADYGFDWCCPDVERIQLADSPVS